MKALTKQLTGRNSYLRKQAFATSNREYIDKDLKYVAHNYKPLPIVIHRGEGIYVWDVEGKRYYDFLCGYSSTN
jgi:ornithine--oxo-acid transaminase